MAQVERVRIGARIFVLGASLNIGSWILVLRLRESPLNLFSSTAFHWVQMPVVAEPEQLPVPEARAGDTAAWDVLFQRYQMPLYVYVRELVGDEQASLDIVQETFISAARHLGSLRENAKFGSWLFGIAHQKCLQFWRKQGRELAAMDELAADPIEFGEDPVDLLLKREQEAAVMVMVDRLPVAQRSVLLLHFVEDFSLDEIAAITNIQLGTVKSRLHYAKKALRRCLEEQSV
jgi:RNA polymerase sigma-70 factor, ECF subfamily